MPQRAWTTSDSVVEQLDGPPFVGPYKRTCVYGVKEVIRRGLEGNPGRGLNCETDAAVHSFPVRMFLSPVNVSWSRPVALGISMPFRHFPSRAPPLTLCLRRCDAFMCPRRALTAAQKGTRLDLVAVVCFELDTVEMQQPSLLGQAPGFPDAVSRQSTRSGNVRQRSRRDGAPVVRAMLLLSHQV